MNIELLIGLQSVCDLQGANFVTMYYINNTYCSVHIGYQFIALFI